MNFGRLERDSEASSHVPHWRSRLGGPIFQPEHGSRPQLLVQDSGNVSFPTATKTAKLQVPTEGGQTGGYPLTFRQTTRWTKSVTEPGGTCCASACEQTSKLVFYAKKSL